MTEYDIHIEYYANYWWSSFTQTIPRPAWGNKEAARVYLEKYWLPTSEYEKHWKPIQDKIFINQSLGLPELVFSENYSLMANRGGCLMEEIDYKMLQPCMLELGNKYFVIVENTYEGKLDEPYFQFKYPTDISWEELMSGNFISSVLLDMYHREYFVFSESGLWGLYAANEYENPLHIVGFKPEYGAFFRKQFVQPQEEWDEIKDWLPPKYKEIIK